MRSNFVRSAWILALALRCSSACADEGPDLAQLVQNPIAKVISVPFQNNLNFGVGPDRDPQDVLNIQPVLPVQINEDWNIISRTIIPVDYQPPSSPDGNGSVVLATSTSRFTFRRHGPAVHSFGDRPRVHLSQRESRGAGSGKFSAGISAVALTIQGPWLVGALVTQVASVSGLSYRRDVNQLLMQPFINYNFPQGWYLTSSPIITANWKASGPQQWVVPVGAGGGRAFRVGKQAMNAQLQAFDDVTHPHGSGNWTLRVQFQLLFPK